MSAIVIGNSWGALGALACLIEKQQEQGGEEIIWLQGNRANASYPLSSLPLSEDENLEIWEKFFLRLNLSWEAPIEGKLFGYRSKNFFEMKALDPEGFWKPEQILVKEKYARFGKSLAEIEEEARSALEKHSIRTYREIPIRSITPGSSETTVILGSGELFKSKQVIYADPWGLLSEIEGLPRPLSFLRKREPSGLLQVNFRHRELEGIQKEQDFCIPLAKDSKTELPRHTFGYFEDDKSTWSVCLASSELEDNHEITKRLRKLKNALEKAFPLLAFQEDAVRFHEEFSVSGAQSAHRLGQIQFLSDGSGPHASLVQLEAVRSHWGDESLSGHA